MVAAGVLKTRLSGLEDAVMTGSEGLGLGPSRTLEVRAST